MLTRAVTAPVEQVGDWVHILTGSAQDAVDASIGTSLEAAQAAGDWTASLTNTAADATAATADLGVALSRDAIDDSVGIVDRVFTSGSLSAHSETHPSCVSAKLWAHARLENNVELTTFVAEQELVEANLRGRGTQEVAVSASRNSISSNMLRPETPIPNQSATEDQVDELVSSVLAVDDFVIRVAMVWDSIFGSTQQSARFVSKYLQRVISDPSTLGRDRFELICSITTRNPEPDSYLLRDVFEEGSRAAFESANFTLLINMKREFVRWLKTNSPTAKEYLKRTKLQPEKLGAGFQDWFHYEHGLGVSTECGLCLYENVSLVPCTTSNLPKIRQRLWDAILQVTDSKKTSQVLAVLRRVFDSSWRLSAAKVLFAVYPLEFAVLKSQQASAAFEEDPRNAIRPAALERLLMDLYAFHCFVGYSSKVKGPGSAGVVTGLRMDAYRWRIGVDFMSALYDLISPYTRRKLRSPLDLAARTSVSIVLPLAGPPSNWRSVFLAAVPGDVDKSLLLAQRNSLWGSWCSQFWRGEYEKNGDSLLAPSLLMKLEFNDTTLDSVL